MEKIVIKKSVGRGEKRKTSYINFVITIKRELMLLAGDTVNFFTGTDFDLGPNAILSGNIVLIIAQTVVLHSGDKIKIRLELSSSTADIEVVKRDE